MSRMKELEQEITEAAQETFSALASDALASLGQIFRSSAEEAKRVAGELVVLDIVQDPFIVLALEQLHTTLVQYAGAQHAQADAIVALLESRGSKAAKP